MVTKAIAFLGYTPPDKPYRETTYCWNDQEWTTPFIAEATARFFHPDQLLILVTKEARNQNYGHLERRLEGLLPVHPVDIPSGQNEEELWQMFTAIARQIEPGDQIIFDITNGYRSLPVLSFLAASHIRVVRQATVAKMIYGAYDASVDGKTPVFDLTPFIRLLDWTTATDAFLKFGRADDLTVLVQEAAQDATQLGAPETLHQIADRLKTLTAALQTSRPNEVMQTAEGLGAAIESVRTATAASAQPFGLLLDKISAEYSRFGLAHPESQALAQEVITRQLEMIDWYIDKHLFVQAITLAREWLVSLVIAKNGGDLFNERDRDLAASAINGHRKLRGTSVPAGMYNTAQSAAIRELWKKTRVLRNDIAHTGMRLSANTAAVLEEQIKRVCKELGSVVAA